MAKSKFDRYREWNKDVTREEALAGFLQSEVRAEEMKMDITYDRDMVNRSIVHTREDVVLLVRHLMGVHIAANRISRLLTMLVWTGIPILAFIAYSVW